MPIYEYECTRCGAVTERIEPFNNPTSYNCLKCKGIAKRILSTFSFVMSDKKRKKELTGWRKGIW